MGLTTEQFLSMEMWQYNAYSEAYAQRMSDQLVIHIQAAWLNAHWAGSSKHKMSLQKALKMARGEQNAPRVAIDKDKAAKAFRQMEELEQNGWTQI